MNQNGMVCKKCGNSIQPNDKFCNKCGTPNNSLNNQNYGNNGNNASTNNGNGNNMLSYIDNGNNADSILKSILKTPTLILGVSILFGVMALGGIILIIVGAGSRDSEIMVPMGIVITVMFVLIFAIVFLGIFIHNAKFNKIIKSNLNGFMNELSGKFYCIHDFNTYFTRNHIISCFGNKKYVVDYNDIVDVRSESVGSTYMKSYNSQGLYHALKTSAYGGFNNIAIRTKDNKKILIPSPNVDDQIKCIIYSKNRNANFDTDMSRFVSQNAFSDNNSNSYNENVLQSNNFTSTINPEEVGKMNKNAIYSVICGVVSIFIFWWLGWVGFVTGIGALAEIKAKNQKGKIVAICGIAISITSVILYFVFKNMNN